MKEAKTQRKNLTWACDGCKKAKVRCSGGTACTRCESRGAQCVYSPQKKRGFPKKRNRKELTTQETETTEIRNDGRNVSGVNYLESTAVTQEHVYEPPTKKFRIDVGFTPDVSPSVTKFNLKQKLEAIIADNNESRKLLNTYMHYFHNQIAVGVMGVQCVLNPTKDVHYVCRLLGYLLTLPFKGPNKVQILQELLFSYGNYIKDDLELDAIICLALITRYAFGISGALCEEWRKKGISLFQKFTDIHQEPELFLPLYKIRCVISLTGVLEKKYNEDELLDVVQDEFIEILQLPEEQVQQRYKCKKAEFVPFWDLAGDPAFRIYYHHNLRFDVETNRKMSSPPWLTLEQADCINTLVDNLNPTMKVSIGVTIALPFVTEILQVHKFSVQESINNNAECLRIARECKVSITSSLNLSQYASFYIVWILPALFKCFLRHSCIREAVEVLDLFKHFTILYPRLKELEIVNKRILDSINSVTSIQSLFEDPISLHQLIKQKTSIKFKTQIPLVLEPQTSCGPPNVNFNVSPFV